MDITHQAELLQLQGNCGYWPYTSPPAPTLTLKQQMSSRIAYLEAVLSNVDAMKKELDALKLAIEAL